MKYNGNSQTRSDLWSDLERLQVNGQDPDPDRLFSKTPETKTPRPRSYFGDSESVSLFWQYGSKINRLAKSDRRLSGLRV